MNSYSSLSCLLSVITTVCGAPFVSPPAKFAGHYANSSTIKEVVGAGSRITDRVALVKTIPRMITHNGDTVLQCCDPPGTVTDQPVNSYCHLCNTMCHIGAMDSRHDSHQLRTKCRCYVVAPCPHISFVINKTLYGSALNNVGNHDNVPVECRTFVTSVGYRLTFLCLSITSWLCMGFTVSIYFYKVDSVHIHYFQILKVRIALFTYITLMAECIKQPTAIYIKPSGMSIYII